MKHLPLKTYLLGVLCVIALTLLANIFFVLSPAYRNIKAVKRDVQHTKELVERTYQRSARLRRSLKEITSVAEAIKKFRGAKIRRGEEISIISDLESLAGQYAVPPTVTVQDV
ncbi:MAG: hypothetical protein AAB932_04240, partial [Patescibacteria group bacterium]